MRQRRGAGSKKEPRDAPHVHLIHVLDVHLIGQNQMFTSARAATLKAWPVERHVDVAATFQA